MSPLVYFFTDFGVAGPYLGQMETALLTECPQARVINLVADAPPFSPRPAAYLLGALVPRLAPASTLVGVVDPGVGTARKVLLLEVDGRRFIAPDNGLLALLLKQQGVQVWEITWRPAALSSSFHGRDLFAPVAGRLLAGREVAHHVLSPHELVGVTWPEQLGEIIYIDHYGNVMSGLRAAGLPPDARFRLGGVTLSRRNTFGAAAPGIAFWYENSLGLVEVAVNQGRADERLGVAVGMPLQRI
jgi:S-adenosylmethionine hydrolase